MPTSVWAKRRNSTADAATAALLLSLLLLFLLLLVLVLALALVLLVPLSVAVFESVPLQLRALSKQVETISTFPQGLQI